MERKLSEVVGTKGSAAKGGSEGRVAWRRSGDSTRAKRESAVSRGESGIVGHDVENCRAMGKVRKKVDVRKA